MQPKGSADASPVLMMRGAETLPDALLERLDRCAEVRKVPRETLLVEQRTPIEELVVLLRGRVSTLVEFSGFGNLAVEYTGEKGRIFGWSALHPPHRAVATVRAETPCTVMFIPMHEVRDMITEEPTWAAALYGMIAGVLADRSSDVAANRRDRPPDDAAPAGPQLPGPDVIDDPGEPSGSGPADA